MQKGHVSELAIHHIKSCERTTVGQAYLRRHGFQHDREHLLVDADLRFMSQREHPRMALISTNISFLYGRQSQQRQRLCLTVRAPGMMDLDLPFVYPYQNTPDLAGGCFKISVWDDTAWACRLEGGYGIKSGRWFSRFLGVPCELVHVVEQGRTHYSSTLDEMFPVRAQDGYPVLLIGQASIVDLNQRMSVQIPVGNFRPNIVVEGFDPYAEDGWKRIRIGNNIIVRVAKPCQRCPIPTIFPGVELADDPWKEEPLRTLLTYRQVSGGGVEFGVNCVIDEADAYVNVGDMVEVLE